MSLRSSVFALAICGAASAVAPATVHAQSALSVMIDQCARGNMAACNQGNAMAIARRQQQIYRNMPAAGNGIYVPCVSPEICGSVGGNALPGNWSWTHNLYGDIRSNYPQVWYPNYPLSYR
jgi:hypothetical protein